MRQIHFLLFFIKVTKASHRRSNCPKESKSRLSENKVDHQKQSILLYELREITQQIKKWCLS